MGFSIKKLGRALDPTSKKSALGSVTRGALNVVAPGSGTALAALGKLNANKGGGSGTVKIAADGKVTLDVPKDSQPRGTPTVGNTLMRANPAMLIGGAAAVAIAIYFLARK